MRAGGVEDCLTEMIINWLRNADPKPTRSVLEKALKSQCVLNATGIT